MSGRFETSYLIVRKAGKVKDIRIRNRKLSVLLIFLNIEILDVYRCNFDFHFSPSVYRSKRCQISFGRVGRYCFFMCFLIRLNLTSFRLGSFHARRFSRDLDIQSDIFTNPKRICATYNSKTAIQINYSRFHFHLRN